LKQNFRLIAWLLLLAIAAGAAWYYLFPSPEQAIQRRLKKLGALISADVAHSNIRKVTNANRIIGYFTPDVVIHTEGFTKAVESLNGSDELLQAIMAARSNTGRVSAQFYNMTVQVNDDTQSAIATMDVIVKISDSGEPMLGQVQVTLKKVERSWLISQVQPIKTNP
jgi:hypothetical protein